MAKKKIQKHKLYFVITHYRQVFLFVFLTFLFLFYPGDSFYVDFFVQKRALFANGIHSKEFRSLPLPYVKNKSLSPIVSAQGVYILDLDSATPIFEKRENDRFLPASTTKIITAITALDTFNLNDPLEVRRASPEGQVVGVLPGDKLHFEHVLYGILVHSGNDTAYMIADNFPGGLNSFIKAMNKKAKDLGMKNSIFKNPAGLDAPGQYTTPFDLALAGRKLLQNEMLARIVSTKSITISDTEFKHFYKLSNINRLLGEIEGVGGLKTGYTEEAGENLVTFYKHGNHQFLIVILKSEDRFKDTVNIVEWIKSNIDYISFDN